MMIKRARFFLLIIVIAILLVSCASPAASPAAEAVSATEPPQEEAQATAPPAAAPDTAEPALSPTAEMDASAALGYPAPTGGGQSGFSGEGQSGYPAPTSAGDGLSYPAPGQGDEAPANTPEIPADVPDPKPGMASISGVIYSSTVDRIVPATMFYLTRAVGENQRSLPPAFFGPLEEQGDIVGRTDDKGQFALDNVPPGNYFLVVEAPPYSWALGLVSEQDTTPRLIELQANQKHALEVVYVSWP